MSTTNDFLPQEIIRRKRDGKALTPEEITFFVKGLSDGSITDGQVAALAMAVHFQGMDLEECQVLTQAMTLSGERLTWEDLDLDGPILDKHSTGGVGDKTSLMLAPILSACGGFVPMVSGRGLGHTGGTLDKLDSIPGYDTTPSLETFRGVVQSAGCAIVGQTGQLAPADDRFYALRDVTATVDPISLITASILSKKLAAGLQFLIMDVKVGSGAFSTNLQEAAELAESIATVGCGAGLPTGALITDMGQVLGRTAGNTLEVRETLDYLTGTYRNERLHELVLALGSELMLVSGISEDPEQAEQRIEKVLSNGSAAERFERMVAGLGGPKDLLSEAEQHLPLAPIQHAVYAEDAGYVQRMDARALGIAVIELGGGRRRPDDTIDPAVGFSDVIGRGELADGERPLAIVHARTQEDAARADATVRGAIEIGSEPGDAGKIVYMKLGPVSA